MKTKHLIFLVAIVLSFLVANYFVSPGKKPAGNDLETIKSETITEIDEEEISGNIDEQTYCSDLQSRKVGQGDLNIIVEPIADNRVFDGQRISGCVYNVAGSYGGWAPFEAQVGSFHLQDNNNVVIVSGPLSVSNGDWMTRAMNGESLQFNGVINFDQKNAGVGLLLLRNENASGEPQLDKTITLPIVF